MSLLLLNKVTIPVLIAGSARTKTNMAKVGPTIPVRTLTSELGRGVLEASTVMEDECNNYVCVYTHAVLASIGQAVCSLPRGLQEILAKDIWDYLYRAHACR